VKFSIEIDLNTAVILIRSFLHILRILNLKILHVFEFASDQRSGNVLLTIMRGSGVTGLLNFDDITNYIHTYSRFIPD